MVALPYPVYDADNHYYETADAFLRHLPKQYRNDFEYVQVDLTKGDHRRPEFLAVNPAGKVPVLVDDD